MTGPIESAIREAQAKINQNNEVQNREDIINELQQKLSTFVDSSTNKAFATAISNILPAIIQSVITAHNKYYNNQIEEEDLNNITNNLQNVIDSITDLQNVNAFSQDLDFDPERLQSLSKAFNKLSNNIDAIKGAIKGNTSEDVETRRQLETSKKALEQPKSSIEQNIAANIRADQEKPEDISLRSQKLKSELKDIQDDTKEFRQSLISLFNIQASSSLSTDAKILEQINKSAIQASEEIKNLNNILINNQLDTPESIQGANISLNEARLQFENLVHDSQNVFNTISQISLGDMSNFYTKILGMGIGFDGYSSEIKASLNKLNINDSEKQQLEQELNNNKQKIEELLRISHEEFSTAFSKKIDDITTSIDTETNKILNQFAVGRGLSQKYIHAFNQGGQAATNIWQIATGIEQTKDRFSFGNIIGFGKPNLSSIKENTSIAGQLQFELQNSIKEFAGLHDEAIKLKEKGLHQKSQATLEMANKMFTNIVNIQAEFSSRSIRAIKKWNQLSEKEKKRLDPTGQMDSTMKNLSRQVQTSNTSVIALAETFNIKMDKNTKYKLEQIKDETKDLVKLDQETSKAKDKTEITMKQLASYVQSAANEVKSIISSVRSTFDSFGGLGSAFAGPFEQIKKLYEYHRKQGQLTYAAMGTDAYIGYSNLDDSAERAYNRLMAGDELFVRSGGRIDREAYDKQYQAILRQVGGRYGSTPEQAVKEAEVLTNQSVLLKNVYGLDDSTIMQTFKTYLKDMDKSPTETLDALAQLTTQAQAANIPLGQYLAKVSSLAETFMQVGLEGEQASIILNMLLQSGVRHEVAEAVTSQVASAASKFSDDKNKVAFAAVMQGKNPFHALAQAAYTHTADGKVRKGWGKEIGSYMDTYINTVMTVYGNDPHMRFMGIVDQLKSMGFDQRSASMLGEIYIEQGNSHMFQQMLEKKMNEMDNPNAKMEDLNKQINEQLKQMVSQLAYSDKLAAQLDSNLWREARHFGTALDQILQTLTPAIIEFQKQMLKFTAEALKFIQKMVTSDLFKSITDSVVETISNIPNFLKDLENKLDELISWGQSLIEGCIIIALIYINYWNIFNLNQYMYFNIKLEYLTTYIN